MIKLSEINLEKGVNFSESDIKSGLLLKKANYIFLGFFFFIIGVCLLLVNLRFFNLFLLSLVVSIILFVSGSSSLGYDELLFTKKELFEEFYLREAWHMEMRMSIFLSFFIGLFFFVGSIILFFLDVEKYFFAVLFCDIVGATILIYGFLMNDYEKKVKKYEKKIDDLKESLATKTWEYQGMDKINF